MNASRAIAASRSSSVSLPAVSPRSSDLTSRPRPASAAACVDLAHDHVEPGPGAHLGDARAHQPAPHHTNPFDPSSSTHGDRFCPIDGDRPATGRRARWSVRRPAGRLSRCLPDRPSRTPHPPLRPGSGSASRIRSGRPTTGRAPTSRSSRRSPRASSCACSATRPARPQRRGPGRRHRGRRPHLARLPARGAPRPALRLARARPVGSREGSLVQPDQAADRPVRQGDRRLRRLDAGLLRLRRRRSTTSPTSTTAPRTCRWRW